ncbi:MAG: WD40 repeat domain-containing protein [Zavarzinella sp.]
MSDHIIDSCWSANGLSVACAEVSGPISLFDVNRGKLVHRLAGHQFGTMALAWHPTEALLASAGQDGKARIWNTQTGELVQEFKTKSSWVTQVCWSAKGKILVTSSGKYLQFWQRDGKLIIEHDAPATISAVVVEPYSAKKLAMASYGGILFFSPTGEPVGKPFPWANSILSLGWSPDGKLLAGGGQDSSVHFWFVKDGKSLEMTGYMTKVTRTVWSPDSKFLITDGGDKVVMWDCSGDGPAGKNPVLGDLHQSMVSALAAQYRAPLVASGDEQGVIGLWYPHQQGKLVAQQPFPELVSHLSWSPGDGRLLAAGGSGTIQLFTV